MEQVKGVHPNRIKEMLVTKNLSRRQIHERFPHLTLRDIDQALQQTSETVEI